MIAEYFIYRRKGDKEPFISLGEMPQYGLRPRQRFTGKKLKIEVIRRLSGVEIEQTATTPQINAYIKANIYDTDRWPEYRKLYRQVAGEVETVADIFTLLAVPSRTGGSDQDGKGLPGAADRSERREADTFNPVRAYG